MKLMNAQHQTANSALENAIQKVQLSQPEETGKPAESLMVKIFLLLIFRKLLISRCFNI